MNGDALRQAAARLYTDRMTAWRTETHIEGNIAQEREVCVYADVPCRLSKDSGEAPEHPADFPVQEQTYTLFTAPDVVLMANDRVTVTRAGATYSGRTERSMIYDICAQTRLALRQVARHD